MIDMVKMLATLNEVFDYANTSLFEGKLPKPVIIISRKAGRDEEYGFFTTGKLWRSIDEQDGLPVKQTYEINISAEYLNRSYYDIVGTLLHEMVHESNKENGKNDCSKNGKHNKKFKAEAERIGMIVTKAEKVGFATSMSQELRDLVDFWNIDFSCFQYYRATEPKISNQKKKGQFVYTSPSDPKKKIVAKYDVQVTDTDTGEIFDKEYEPGTDEQK